MSVVDFADLQALSGYRQVSKVIDWLREQRDSIRSRRGRFCTTDDMLRKVLDVETEDEATPIRFG